MAVPRQEVLSPWWEHAVPIPQKVVDPQGKVLFTRRDILGGQQVSLKHGLMENGSVWGHGAYLGPDFSAAYLHRALLAGTAAVLFASGRFDFLGRATVKYFALAALLFLIQALVGGATAHYRADPSGFYGIDLSRIFPSHILCTWHLQLAVFWIATAYIAGVLFLASALGKRESKGRLEGIPLLLVAGRTCLFLRQASLLWGQQ